MYSSIFKKRCDCKPNCSPFVVRACAGQAKHGDSSAHYAMAGSFCCTLLRLGWRRDGWDDWKLSENGGAMSDGVGWEELEHSADTEALEMLPQLFPISTCFDLFCCCASCFADLPEGCRDISLQVELARGCGHLHSGTKHHNSRPLSPKTAPNQPSGYWDRHNPLFLQSKGRELGGICVVLALTVTATAVGTFWNYS